ncbi:MAG TPA: endonuclease domain-containing protein [Pseudolabrys sp.]|nr:endonuclease domain-containing protein [Pseudolabrys sp.]
MSQGFHHRPVARRSRGFARSLRRMPTAAEKVMWQLLRHRRLAGAKFRRQVLFQNYILDFVCFEKKIVIEVDGSHHFDSKRDEQRDAIIDREGFRVLRYWDNDVLQRSASVLDDIFAHLTDDQN